MKACSGSVNRGDHPIEPNRGFAAFGIFLCFGTLMASLAGVTLVWRGTVLDRIWLLNPAAYRQLELASFRRVAGILFLMLGAVLAVAAFGWHRRQRWGWKLAVAIIAVQLLGDLVNALRGDIWRGSIGSTIAAALLFYLWRVDVRARFQ